MKVAVLLKQK